MPVRRTGWPNRAGCPTPAAPYPDELEEINLAARTSGNDVKLDAILLRLHTETACRRGGAIGLQLADLDIDRGLVQLREKGEVLRWQPITLELAAALAEHAGCRGAMLPTDALLRFRYGTALTSRRYDHLWHRVGQGVPWVAAQGISTHWLRHTTLTWVERKLAHLVRRRHGGRRARMRGTLRIGADFALLAAAVNLARLAKLGLAHRSGGWVLSPARTPDACRKRTPKPQSQQRIQSPDATDRQHRRTSNRSKAPPAGRAIPANKRSTPAT